MQFIKLICALRARRKDAIIMDYVGTCRELLSRSLCEKAKLRTDNDGIGQFNSIAHWLMSACMQAVELGILSYSN